MMATVSIEKRFSWTEYSRLGFSALDLRRKAKEWLEFVNRFKYMDLNCYKDYCMIQLTERKGQIQQPVVLAYKNILLDLGDDDGCIYIDMPRSHLIFTLLDKKNFKQGDLALMADLIRAGGGSVTRVINGQMVEI